MLKAPAVRGRCNGEASSNSRPRENGVDSRLRGRELRNVNSTLTWRFGNIEWERGSQGSRRFDLVRSVSLLADYHFRADFEQVVHFADIRVEQSDAASRFGLT